MSVRVERWTICRVQASGPADRGGQLAFGGLKHDEADTDPGRDRMGSKPYPEAKQAKRPRVGRDHNELRGCFGGL